ncbi:MAG: hypothetical protein ABSB57_03235 [Dehalococcoidia bacterium]
MTADSSGSLNDKVRTAAAHVEAVLRESECGQSYRREWSKEEKAALEELLGALDSLRGRVAVLIRGNRHGIE